MIKKFSPRSAGYDYGFSGEYESCGDAWESAIYKYPELDEARAADLDAAQEEFTEGFFEGMDDAKAEYGEDE